jgi:hypothetical protein
MSPAPVIAQVVVYILGALSLALIGLLALPAYTAVVVIWFNVPVTTVLLYTGPLIAICCVAAVLLGRAAVTKLKSRRGN